MEHTMENDAFTIVQNKHSQRFEIDLKNGIYAFLEYRWSGKNLALMHVEVPNEWQNKGLAGKIVHHVMEFAKSEGLKIKPYCPYVLAYLRNNPQYQSLVEGTFNLT